MTESIYREIYNVYTNHYVFKYAATTLGLIFIFHAYKNAKKWMSIATGKYSVIGEVTYSEHGWYAGWRKGSEAAVYYKYYIGKNLYTGAISRKFLLMPGKRAEFIKKYPPGTKEVVYYSIDDPGFSYFGKYPNETDVAFYAISWSFFWWFFINSTIGFVVWVLSHAPKH